ncbi:LOW QUALITY PROTEIN: NADH dehydrogenase subunit 5 [Vespula squamosa]|uniref:NADH:ubiquinone reductase (H(+)-translocating) n=1 Tax=Vespula squamosa TaxID=30214 RepID=A0ABD2BI47_VESSQ
MLYLNLLLFLCGGILIHQIRNNQDIRYIGSLIRHYPFVRVVFYISLLSLCGFPFFFLGHFWITLIDEDLVFLLDDFLDLKKDEKFLKELLIREF